MNLSPRQPAGGQHTRLRPIDTVRPASSPGTSSVPRVVGEDAGSMGAVFYPGDKIASALVEAGMGWRRECRVFSSTGGKPTFGLWEVVSVSCTFQQDLRQIPAGPAPDTGRGGLRHLTE